MTCRSFNIRVYGVLFNDREEVLLTDEDRFDRQFTKFPGGGLKLGEGIRDCLKREFREELDIEIDDFEHMYTTDFFQESSFDDSQVISIYYRVWYDNWDQIETVSKPFDFNGLQQVFRWESVDQLTQDDLTFPIDKHVLAEIKGQ